MLVKSLATEAGQDRYGPVVSFDALERRCNPWHDNLALEHRLYEEANRRARRVSIGASGGLRDQPASDPWRDRLERLQQDAQRKIDEEHPSEQCEEPPAQASAADKEHPERRHVSDCAEEQQPTSSRLTSL